jgi:ankyrin repeat protein
VIYIMAPGKGKETLLGLCSRTTNLGNSISVRMLEYLSTVKSHPFGFRDLATDFLDTCRILWSIEAGLTEASRRQNQLPLDMVQELDGKFRQTNDNFIVLNHMLLKFLDYDKKGALGKLQKGWRMMFTGTDIEKMRESLAKCRDALRMSALVFRWSIGDTKADASVGIGYTGLMAALERMRQDRPTTIIPPLQPSPLVDHELPPQLPPVSLVDRSPAATPMPSGDDGYHISPKFVDQGLGHVTSSVSRELTIHSTRNHSASPRNGIPHHEVASTDSLSEDTAKSMTLIEDHLQEMDNSKLLEQVIRLKADPATVPRWTPRRASGSSSINKKSALMNAVLQKNHKTVEQLLDSGVGADGGMEPGILIKAVLNRDAESIRLLLLFGADPNAMDHDKFTPLYSATKVSFADGAKMLIKHGADPNLCAGPEGESSLALAIGENNLELVKLYLSYGGDASLIMENGNTALIKAINKTVSSKVVELMLNYETDPNSKNREGKTALFEAIQSSRVDLMTLLLDHGADPNLPGPKHLLWPSTYQPKALSLMLQRGADPKKTPGIMELAAGMKNVESISILLDAGVSPNTKKDGIYTPLCSAIRDNSVEIVTLLLANGANPNLKASEYPAFKCVTHHRIHILPQLVAAGANLQSPKGIIEKAVAHNNKEALMYLLENGVSPNDKSDEGYTPLTTAIREDRIEILDILLKNGADPTIRGQDWPICMAVKRPAILKKLLPSIPNPRAIRGVMEMAVVANQIESIKMLLNAGVSVEDKNGGVFSPLTTAIREDRKDLVKFFLDEANADPNTPGEHLPIIKAIRRYRGDTEIIEMLLAKGASINQMYRGWNAVLQAVENGDANILRLLVEKGGPVDLNVTDETNKPMKEILAERGWSESSILVPGKLEPRQ